MDGRIGSNFTGPGPLNKLQLPETGGGPMPGRSPPRPASAPGPRGTVSSAVATLSFGGSSVSHASSGSGLDTVVVYVAAIPEGGPVNDGPFGFSRTTGGVFFD